MLVEQPPKSPGQITGRKLLPKLKNVFRTKEILIIFAVGKAMNKRTAANLTKLKDIDHGFFGRQGGVSKEPWDSLNTCYFMGDTKKDVDKNRLRICKTFHLKPASLFTTKQVHGTNALRITAGDDPEKILHTEADAIWTSEPNIAVGVQTADCAPILFASDDGQVVGAIHAGWRGAVSGIVTKTIESVGKIVHLSPDRFIVAIGPCIGQDAFEVGPEVIAAVEASGHPINDVVKKGRADRSHLDLAGFIKLELQSLGIRQIELIGCCTASNIDEYFSYRGNKGRRGDQLSVITKST